jgi:hypothetical protein
MNSTKRKQKQNYKKKKKIIKKIIKKALLINKKQWLTTTNKRENKISLVPLCCSHLELGGPIVAVFGLRGSALGCMSRHNLQSEKQVREMTRRRDQA